jgi:asparagine synthase (glutamine-hydrolysing)
MCGFAGRFHPNSLPIDFEWSAKANRLLTPRGPDGEGTYTDERCDLVHRRLALIDLSPTGRQPMENEDGSVIVVFNGEIYNHRALRKQLEDHGHQFRGSSDTEVLVHLYEEYGEAMIEFLRGMFAFAIYDRRRNQILLVRDRFGIKPLYYAEVRGQFVFASEIKAILALNGFTPGINRQACYDFLGLGYIPEPETGFEEIHALPPGSTMIRNGSGDRLIHRGSLRAQPEKRLTLETAAEQSAEALLESVRAQSIADVPVAALLSGGIDSSLIVAAYGRAIQRAPTTFNVGFPDRAYDETPLARAVATHCGADLHTLELEDFSVTPELVKRLLLHFDQPFADSSLIPTYFVSRAIRRQGIICALSGDGGDEAFGGYASFWRANAFAKMMQLPKLVQRGAELTGAALARYTENFGRRFAKAFRLAGDGAKDSASLLAGLASYLSEAQKQEIITSDARRSMNPLDRLYDGYLPRGTTDLEEISLRMTETYFRVGLTSDMLRKVDMMSMLAGIEVRVPLLDETLVESGLRLPHRLKTDGKTGKLVLREIARKWLPENVARHRKQGFAIPLDRLATPAFHEMLDDLLAAPRARVSEFLNARLIEEWLVKFRASRNDPVGGAISREGLYQRVLILLALELWLREHRLSW